MSTITLSKLTRRYYLGGNTVIEPVKDISLDISQGEFVVIVGRSGSGKTTLLNLIAGLITPSYGTVRFDDMDIQKMDDRQMSSFRSREIGFVFQFPSLLPSLTVMENAMLPCDFAARYHGHSVSDRAKELLEMVGLSERTTAYPKQLSAGEQRRAVIARALMNEPKVVLADEPTSDLDEKTEQEIMDLFIAIHSGGVTVIMATHNLRLVSFASMAFKMENSHLTDISKTTNPSEIFEI